MESQKSRIKDGFQELEIHKTILNIPERYTNIKGIGAGAFGQVL